jgi:Tol biopolymer transport system component/DNA-binding winged helix-turn-helix (wHTH) protein
MFRFGPFQLDPRAHELRRDGVRVKIQEQSYLALRKLVENPGVLVTREELCKAIWSADTFVDFDASLNKIIKQLRKVLGDSAEAPAFIETAPGLGYRFVVPVECYDVTPSAKTRSTYYIPAVLGAIIAALGALALWKTALQIPGTPGVLRFTALTSDGQGKSGPMGTDGSRIYFNETLPGQRDLVVQVSVKGGEVVPLSVPLRQPRLMDLSKDGNELLIANSEGARGHSLWLQTVAGGSPRRIGAILIDGDARFGADATNIVYRDGRDIKSVSLNGSIARRFLEIDKNRYPYSFGFSPDATVFRFSQFDTEYEDQLVSATLMETTADGMGVHKLFSGCCGRWTPDGRFFIFIKRVDGRNDLWALTEQKHPLWRNRDRAPFQLTAGPLSFGSPLPSKDGKKVFAIGESPRAEIVRYDSHTGEFVPYLSGISAEGLAFSRDGQWVTYASYPDGTLWRSKIDGSERRQLSFPPMRVLLPRWSPDGKQIAFNAIAPGVPWNIYLISSEGGTPQRILPSEHSEMDANWSPDGNSLVFGSLMVPNTPISTIDLDSMRVTTLPGSIGLYSPRWSPDGKYIAAITTETPHKLMLFEFTVQKWKELFSFEMGYPSWSRDGKHIYFVDAHGQNVPFRVARLRLRDRKIENIVDFQRVGRLTVGTLVEWFGVAPDDSPLMARDISTQELYAIDVKWPLD